MLILISTGFSWSSFWGMVITCILNKHLTYALVCNPSSAPLLSTLCSYRFLFIFCNPVERLSLNCSPIGTSYHILSTCARVIRWLYSLSSSGFCSPPRSAPLPPKTEGDSNATCCLIVYAKETRIAIICSGLQIQLHPPPRGPESTLS